MLASSAVRWLPRDFVEVSQTGGLFTLAAYVLMLVVFICEVRSFAMPGYSNTLLLDHHDSETLQINFDVDLYDIECRNVKVAVFAQAGEERIESISQDFWLRSIDQRGHKYGMAIGPSKEEEEDGGEASAHEKQMEGLIKEDGKSELDADWSTSHDGFKHKSFDHVIQSHDFTFINFFAGWCGHCQKFSPTWAALAAKVNGEGASAPMEFPDRDGQQRKIRMIKMNCVDFKGVCHEKGIDAYPMLRLYKADGTFSLYEGKRAEPDLLRWMERTVKMKSYGWGVHHEAFERGCNAKGRLQVPRVPGHLELTAGGGDQNLNTKMTNVSHIVKHLSFSDPGDGRYHRKGWGNMPAEVTKHFAPLDGKTFVTTDFHQAWVHDMKVVSTVGNRGTTGYQISHQKRLNTLREDDIPQAQFHYDIEPFSIVITRNDKRWYDFVTSLLAMLGGSFVVMRLAARVSLSSFSTMIPRRANSGGELGF